jgi:lipooligosaccharide transport system ATP-binding protein
LTGPSTPSAPVVGAAEAPRSGIKPPVVEGTRLSKKFGESVAVDGIDFVVREGECCGFLGPNGAGKTTTVRMISCVSPVSGGEIRVFGMSAAEEPRRIKALLGVCPQEDNLDPDFSVLNNLLVYARYFGIPRRELGLRARELYCGSFSVDRTVSRLRAINS